jgi:hypothetical protein
MKGVFEVLSYPQNQAANPSPCSTSSTLARGWNELLLFCWAELSSSLVHQFLSHQAQEEALQKTHFSDLCVTPRQRRLLFISHGTARLLFALGFLTPFSFPLFYFHTLRLSFSTTSTLFFPSISHKRHGTKWLDDGVAVSAELS